MSLPLNKAKTKTRAVENLSARVYNQIKRLILCNEIMPGQKLHHQELSERLGVSRTPVREALTRLVQEGYVSFLPNRGFTCKEIRIQEAEELYELREALEAFAVERVRHCGLGLHEKIYAKNYEREPIRSKPGCQSANYNT